MQHFCCVPGWMRCFSGNQNRLHFIPDKISDVWALKLARETIKPTQRIILYVL